MKEVTIRYRNKKVLEILKDLSKYFEFSVVSSGENEEQKQANFKISKLNGISVIPGDSSIDISELKKIFSNKDIDARKVREEIWHRVK